MSAIPEYPFFHSLKQEEIWRYLGYRNQQPDETVCEKISICLEKLLSLAEPRRVYQFYDISFPEGSSHTSADSLPAGSSYTPANNLPGGSDPAPVNNVLCDSEQPGNALFLEGILIRSRSLARHLQGCHRVCLMAATIGPAPDRLSERAMVLGKLSEAAIYQAAGAALEEAWCDEVNEEIRLAAEKEGLVLRTRYSPGYGDFSLQYQKDLFRLLNVTKRTGITLSESLMMMPSKSVTAVIGIAKGRTGTSCTPAAGHASDASCRPAAEHASDTSCRQAVPPETAKAASPLPKNRCSSCSLRETCLYRRELP